MLFVPDQPVQDEVPRKIIVLAESIMQLPIEGRLVASKDCSVQRKLRHMLGRKAGTVNQIARALSYLESTGRMQLQFQRGPDSALVSITPDHTVEPPAEPQPKPQPASSGRSVRTVLISDGDEPRTNRWQMIGDKINGGQTPRPVPPKGMRATMRMAACTGCTTTIFAEQREKLMAAA
jgi:hypothetical protein